MTTTESTIQPTHARGAPAAISIILGWFAAVVLLGSASVFESPGNAPPVALGLAALLPPVLVVALLAWSRGFRAWARSLDLRLLTLLQMWRVAGFAFLGLLAVGALPAGFAVPAGAGDIIVGVTAPLVAVFLIGAGRLSRLGYLGWTMFGAADLIGAITLGVLHSSTTIGLLATEPTTDIMAQLPLSLIPTFGVPFTLVLHALSLSAASNPAWWRSNAVARSAGRASAAAAST